MYLSPEFVSAVVDEQRRDSMRAADRKRRLREAGVEPRGILARLGYQLSQVVGGRLIAVGQWLMQDELSPRMPAVKPPIIRRA